VAGLDNTVSALTTNGEFASNGQVTRRRMSRLWIITNGRKMMDETLSPIHPGEILLEDFMRPLGLSQYRLAHGIGVTPIRISQIVNGKRSITVDTAMRPARDSGTSAAVWLRLQVRYDLEVAERELSDKINKEVKVFHQTAGHV
jgi:addiction module HigA family antidote